MPQMSQSPAVTEIEVTLAAVPDVRLTSEPTRMQELMTSPTLPAEAAVLVAMPGSWPVVMQVPLVVIATPKQVTEVTVPVPGAATQLGTPPGVSCRKLVPELLPASVTHALPFQ